MADWTKPTLASAYANFVTEINGKSVDAAVMFDPAIATAASNLPTGTVRWRAAGSKWEKWSGTVWSDLSSNYAINISGNAANITGVASAINGGTGQSAYATGDVLFASSTTALGKLTAVTTGNVLLSGGVGVAPAWGKVDLSAHTTGTAPVAAVSNAIKSATTSVNTAAGAAPTVGQILTATGSSAATWQAPASALALASTVTGAGATTAYGTVTLKGGNSGYGGVNFKNASGTNLGTLMSNGTGHGFYNVADTNWSWYCTDAGIFTATNNVGAYSDERLKNNWEVLPVDFVERLSQVKSGTYDRVDLEGRHVGVGAQSLQKLLPEAVMTNDSGVLSVTYGNAALAACVELAKRVVALEARLAELQK